MLETAAAHLRLGASIVFGIPLSRWSLERLVDALLETRAEFGVVYPEGAELLEAASLDDETRRDLEIKRFRAQAKRAARETPYYRSLFEELALDPARLRRSDLSRVPVTTKRAFRATPDAFVRRSARPTFQTTTTGTTGHPVLVRFSSDEIRAYALLAAISELVSGHVGPDDVVQLSTSSRATLGNTCFGGACARIGALVYLDGIRDPEQALRQLAERRTLPGKKPRTSILSTYPSYLGMLVETGLGVGYRPADFGLERIFVSGEVVTAGVKERARHLFGAVQFVEGYAMTETWPLSGVCCSEGHLHFEPSQGLVEVVEPLTGDLAQPSAVGSIVATPFPPYRDTTIVLRYDTEDLVRPVEGPMSCERRRFPATTNLLGKRSHAVRHRDGWTTTRDMLEALEGAPRVPLPARCGFWAEDGGVAVEVVADAAGRAAIGRRLEDAGVPLTRLLLREASSSLERPLPLRCDLQEMVLGHGRVETPPISGVPDWARGRWDADG